MLFEVTLSDAAVSAEMPRAAEALSHKLDIKGFRKGKVPQDILEKHVGKARLFEEAGYSAIEKTYKALFKEHDLHPVGQPKVEIKKLAPGNPLLFSITIALVPDVVLPDYRALAKKAIADRKAVEVKPEEVEETVSHIQKSRRKEVLVARPAKKGDLTELDFEVRIAGVKLDGGDSRNHPVILGESKFIPGFDEYIEGMQAKEEKTFSLKVPEDYYQEQLRGKLLDFAVTVNAVYELALPALDDEFAQSLSAFDTLEALEKDIAQNIRKEKEAKETERIRKLFAEEAAEKATIDLPDMLVDQEVNKMISELEQSVTREDVGFESYLLGIKKTRDDLKKEFRKQAEVRVRVALVLAEIAKRENIELDEADVRRKTEQVLGRYDEREKANIDKALLRQYVSSIMKNESVFKLLEL